MTIFDSHDEPKGGGSAAEMDSGPGARSVQAPSCSATRPKAGGFAYIPATQTIVRSVIAWIHDLDIFRPFSWVRARKRILRELVRAGGRSR